MLFFVSRNTWYGIALMNRSITIFHTDQIILFSLSLSLSYYYFLNNQIRFESRLKCDRGRTCKTYHDATDYKVQNRPNAELVRKSEWQNLPYDPVYYCQKFKCSGVRYGVTTVNQTGEICDAVGPFPCGKYHDLTIFENYVQPLLNENEMVETDRGYRNIKCRNPEDFFTKSEREAKKRLAARHEVVNTRFKDWRSLFHMFRHDVHEHKYFFFYCCNC